MLQKTPKRPGLNSKKTAVKEMMAPMAAARRQTVSFCSRRWSDFKNLVKKNDGKKDLLSFTVLLTNIMTLMAWRTMDLVRAEYEGKAATYRFCQIAIAINLAALLLHGICMVGYRRWKAVYTCISGTPKAVGRFWSRLSPWGRVGFAAVPLALVLVLGGAFFLPRSTYCAQVVECFGVPVAQGGSLNWRDRKDLAGYWRIDDYPLQKRMTLTYVEAYRQLNVMSNYSTLYERAFFQPTDQIEITYRTDKNFYRNYQEDFYSAASQIGYRVPVRMSYRSSGGKLVLDLERDSRGNMEIVAYSPEDKPQLLNATLLRIPEGQTGENGILGQKIETVYGPDGLPELRRLYSKVYNLYGVNGERYFYNRDQQLSALCYLDADGEPACNKMGVMRVEFEYQDDANLRSIRYYGDQKGTECVEGFHGVFCEILEYDEEGKNIKGRRQKDRSENWCFDKNGVYQYCYHYEKGALIREEYLGVDNSPIQNNRFSSCWIQFRAEDRGRRICVELEPVSAAPESGEHTASGAFPALEAAVLASGNILNVNSQGADGSPKVSEELLDTSHKAAEKEPDSNRLYSRIQYTLKNGVVTEISYWSGEGSPVPGEQGCAATRFDYQESRVVRESYWDSDGQPCVLSGGYAAVEYVYRTDGEQDLARTIYLDADGDPVINRDLGCAIVCYSPGHDLMRISYYDKDGSLIPLPDKGYAAVERRYDTNGFLTQETFYDAKDSIACRSDFGVAKIRYEYAPDGNLIRESYWDQEDNAVSRRDTGYAVLNQTFAHGQLTEKRFEAYRDRAYYPVPDRETGAEIITYRYKDGLKVEEQYLDAGRNPILSADLGCAVLRFEYDQGRLSKKSALGLQNELVLRKDAGCAIVACEYDEFGREKWIHYLDTAEKPICRSDNGCAKIQYGYDSLGRRSFVKYYGTDGELVIHRENGYAGVNYSYPGGNNQTWEYIGLDEKPFPRLDGHGIAVVNKLYDSTGKLQGENYEDACGAPAVWKDHGYSALSYQYDENGLKMREDFLGPDGEPALRLDRGYASRTYEYDNAGRIIRTRFYGENQEPVIDTEYHCAGFEYEYNERGLESVIRYLGLEDDTLMIRLDYGFSEVRRSYDSAGNLVGERYYVDGKEAVWKERGYASYLSTYQNGLWTESRYYDDKGDLTPRLDRGYAIIRREYDARGRCIRELYYDAEEKAVISPYYNCAGFEYSYNEKGLTSAICYLNSDGQPMIRPDLGYAQVRKEYDDAGNLIAEYYLDTNGDPAVYNDRGYSYYRDTFENGKCVRSQYFGTDGKPAAWKGEGHFSTRRKYNELGQLTDVYYCDADGELMINREKGCAGYRYGYDSLGNQTDTWYVSPEGEDCLMVRDSVGYAHIFSEYNEFGQETAVYYYLSEDKSAPAVVKDQGYSSVKKTVQNNRCVQVEYFGLEGERVLRSDEGYSVVKYEYDACGQKISVCYYGVDGESLIFNQKEGYAGFRYGYDEFGNETDYRYLGADGQPVLRKDWGVAHITNQYNSYGNAIYKAYYTGQEQYTTKKNEGYAYSESEYRNGKCVETRYYDAAGKPVLRLDGKYAVVRYEYDAFGRCVAQSYLGQDGTPVINTEEHYASVRWAYDDRGRQSDTWYYGLDGTLICHSDRGYAHVHSEYDLQGNEIYAEYRGENEELVLHKTYGFAYAVCEYWNEDGKRYAAGSYYDTEGNPVARADRGFARYVDTYDDHGNWIEGRCLDAQGNPVRRTDHDYATIRMVYDLWNRRTRETYFDEYDNPTVSKHYGCAGFENEYDGRGNKTAIRYLAPGGGLMIRTGYGFAQAVRSYDDQGRLTWEQVQDEQGNPAAWENRGYAFYAVLYNDIGKKESEWFYNEAQELAARSDLGYAYVRYQYNENGLLSREDYYNPNHELVLHKKENCASIGYGYDERGNRTDIWYYGTDQNLINREDTGASLCFRVFDTLDRQTKIAYYIYENDNWRLVNRKDLGYAAIIDIYDEKGFWIERSYLDAEEQPIVCPAEGYATQKRTYNENGLVSADLYLDEAGSPVDASGGRAKWEWEYDEKGSVVKRMGYHAEELPGASLPG